MYLNISYDSRHRQLSLHSTNRQRPQYAFKTLVQYLAVAGCSLWCRHDLNDVLERLTNVNFRFNNSKIDKHETVFMPDEVERYEVEGRAQEPYRFVTSSLDGAEWSI